MIAQVDVTGRRQGTDGGGEHNHLLPSSMQGREQSLPLQRGDDASQPVSAFTGGLKVGSTFAHLFLDGRQQENAVS